MKTTKKMAGILLALVMLLAMAVPVWAEPTYTEMQGSLEGGSITVNQAIIGQTYNLYQLAYLEGSNPTNNAYTYQATTAWKDFLSSASVSEYTSVDSNGYVTWKSADINASYVGLFAQKAIQHAKTEPVINPVRSITATTDTVEFTGLKQGWYLVDTTVGTLCFIRNSFDDNSVTEKNFPPTLTKKVRENGSTGVDTNDVSVGKDIEFMITISPQPGAQNYVVHDNADDGITFTGITGINYVKSDKTEQPLTKKDPTNPDQEYQYEVIENPATDTCDFHIVFTQAFLDKLVSGDQIDIKYTGKLNQNAVIGPDGNKNTAWLAYGENGEITTEAAITTTKTWEFSILKYTRKTVTTADEEGKATVNTPLAGATFKLCTTDDPNAEGIAFSPVTVEGKENAYKCDLTSGTTKTFTSDSNGKIYLQGLDSGTYYLFETNPPDGYNKLTSSTNVVIGPDGTVKKNTQEATDKVILVENNTGTLLPQTGGIGTTIFYIVGGVLLVGAGVLLVVRKRMSAAKESK